MQVAKCSKGATLCDCCNIVPFASRPIRSTKSMCENTLFALQKQFYRNEMNKLHHLKFVNLANSIDP